MDFEIAVLRGRVVDFDPCDGMIDIIKNGVRKSITYEQFDDMFYVINEISDAALKEDCIWYMDVEDGVLLKNKVGDEMTISIPTFLEIYTT